MHVSAGGQASLQGAPVAAPTRRPHPATKKSTHPAQPHSHPVSTAASTQVTAFYTPHPPLARQQLQERLQEVREELMGPGGPHALESRRLLLTCFLVGICL